MNSKSESDLPSTGIIVAIDYTKLELRMFSQLSESEKKAFVRYCNGEIVYRRQLSKQESIKESNT